VVAVAHLAEVVLDLEGDRAGRLVLDHPAGGGGGAQRLDVPGRGALGRLEGDGGALPGLLLGPQRQVEAAFRDGEGDGRGRGPEDRPVGGRDGEAEAVALGTA
jgi:hypothetical protein